MIDGLRTQVNESAEEANLNSKKFSISAKNFVPQHTWPGNVRELLSTLHRAAIWTDEDVFGLEAVSEAIWLRRPLMRKR
jgi:DNA-binding NtrC family response regulator